MQLSISKVEMKINEDVLIINKNNNFSQNKKSLIIDDKIFLKDTKTLQIIKLRNMKKIIMKNISYI